MKVLTILSAIVLALSAFAETGNNHARIFEVKVTKKGFEPSSIKAKSNENVTLKITRMTDSTCARKVTVPDKKITQELPLNQPVDIQLGRLEKGEIRFGCAMGMMLGGVISVN